METRAPLTRLLFMAVIGIGLALFTMMNGWRDVLLVVGRETTTARVTSVYQPPPGIMRASDHQVVYEFVDRAGVTHRGEDVLPPAYPPRSDGTLTIVYRVSDPAVSRIASQLSTTPITGLILSFFALGWVAIQLNRMRQMPGRSAASV